MEKLRRRFEEAEKAISSLEEIFSLEAMFSKEHFKILRDATIQRFEYTFEVMWKLLKEFLQHKEGIVCNSPKSCFRACFSVGLLDEDETISFIQMTDDRNLTSHTYNEEVAELLYERIREYTSS